MIKKILLKLRLLFKSSDAIEELSYKCGFWTIENGNFLYHRFTNMKYEISDLYDINNKIIIKNDKYDLSEASMGVRFYMKKHRYMSDKYILYKTSYKIDKILSDGTFVLSQVPTEPKEAHMKDFNKTWFLSITKFVKINRKF